MVRVAIIQSPQQLMQDFSSLIQLNPGSSLSTKEKKNRHMGTLKGEVGEIY